MPFGQVIPVTGTLCGFPGTVAEMGDPLPITKPVLSTSAKNINFGDPVVVIPNSAGGDAVVNVADYVLTSGSGGQGGAFTAALFAGIAIREVKQGYVYPVNPDVPTSASYAPNEQCGFLVRGTISIQVNVGTPLSQGRVYVRVALNVAIPAGIVGGFEAQADGANTIQLSTNILFKDGNVDANGVTAVTILERTAA